MSQQTVFDWVAEPPLDFAVDFERALVACIQTGQPFTSEMVRADMAEHAVDWRCIGGLFKSAANAGRIMPLPRMSQATRAASHRRPVRQWICPSSFKGVSNHPLFVIIECKPNRSLAGRFAYWLPDRAGLTESLHDAGRFTMADLATVCAGAKRGDFIIELAPPEESL